MLTLYSTFRPFYTEHTTVHQRDAIRSWLLLKPKPQILIVGEDDSTKSVCEEFDLEIIESEFSEYGTPFLEPMMRNAEKHAKHDIMLLVSGDIVLYQETMIAAEALPKQLDMFCACIEKTDCRVNSPPIDFNSNWVERTKNLNRKTVSTSGDFFMHPKGFLDALPPMPPFVIGRGMCDSWLLYFSKQAGFLVDMTQAVSMYHVKHGHKHWTNRQLGTPPECEDNYSNNPHLKECSGFQVKNSNYTMRQDFSIKKNIELPML